MPGPMYITMLLERRAQAAAKLEALSGMDDGRPVYRDEGERKEFTRALVDARRNYSAAEASLNQATSTMTAEELARMGL